MSTPHSDIPAMPGAPKRAQDKSGIHTKSIATRITPEELREIETTAKRDGKTPAEWLRDLALKGDRERLADPIEILLAEQSTMHYALLNLFYATAHANAEGKHLLADSVLRIRDQASARKLADARKLIESFHALEQQNGAKR